MNELVSLTQLAGTLVFAKREFLNHQKYSRRRDSEFALLRCGSGVAGVADARILAAYQAMARRQSAHPHHPS